MADNWANLSGGRFLADLYAKDSIQASFLQKIINGINKLGSTLGANPVGDVQPPPPINNINVTTSGEYLHFNLNHNSPVTKAIKYFAEVDTDPNFSQPQVMDLGASRSPLPVWLPSKDSNGSTQKYYLRAYCQYPGSKPSEKTVFGGALNPTSITMGGSSELSLLPSTGSGTGSPTGQQGGSGLGTQQVSTNIVKVQPQITASVPPAVPTVTPPVVTPVSLPSIAFFKNQDLVAPVTVPASTLTLIDNIGFQLPNSGGPYRILVRYQYFMNGGVGYICSVFDPDFSRQYFAVTQGNVGNNNSAPECSELSPITYDAGEIVVFSVYIFGDGNSTIVLNPSLEGSPSRLYNMGVSHISVAAIASN